MADEQRSFRRLNFSRVVPGSILQTIVIDVVCPYMMYPLIANRVPAGLALLLVALFPLAHIAISLLRQRTLDLIGVGTLLLIASIFVGSAFHGDIAPTLRYVLPIGLFGIITLLSALLPRPIFFAIDRYVQTHEHPGQLARYKAFWWDVRTYRRMIRIMNTVWGITQALLALLLFALFFVTPHELYPALLPFAALLPYITLIIWTVQYRYTCARRWITISQELHVEPKEEEFLV